MLLDSFGRPHNYLRIALTESCNFRCTYCMPLQKVILEKSAKIMKADEIETIAKEFVRLGVTKIRLTGGEPLLRKDFAAVLEKLAKLPVTLGITTNGMYLGKHLDLMQASGMKALNISLDTLKPDRFIAITGIDAFRDVMDNIIESVRRDFFVKVNMVIMKGVNDDEVLEFVELTRNLPLHIRFIEYMPFDGNQWDEGKVMGHHEILEQIQLRLPVVKLIDQKHDTTKKYKIEGYEGTFSVISTVSEPFCDSCNRLRLTADGKMKNCLFSDKEVYLLKALRAGENIAPLILKSVAEKKWQQGDQELGSQMNNRSMVLIGG